MSRAFRPVLLIVAALAAVTGVSLLLQPHERVPWRQDFQTASAEARRTGKPMLVDFTASWCDACQEMRRTTWSDANVEQALRDYVPVQVNVDFNQKLATQYGAAGLPHLAVLDPRGKVLKEIEGAMGPGEFVAWLHSTGAGPSPRPMLGLVAISGIDATAAELALHAETNVMQEVRFEAVRSHPDPFNDVTLDVVFTDPAGSKLRVAGFWGGGKVWKVRYASGVVGAHRFRSECSDTSDSGLHGVEGQLRVEPYRGDNRLYLHGPIRVAADRRHFEHADGTPFLWLADTWWMGLCKRLHWPDEFELLTADRKGKGFNVIQIVAGLYPDQGPFDPRGANETGFPWEKDYARIRPEYFDAADARIRYLVDQGLVPCIVGAWGYHLPWLGEARMKRHMRYLMARYGAMPVVWCVAGEVNLPYYLTPGFPNGGEKQTVAWARVIRYTRSVNAFGRPITTHPTGILPLSARGVLKDAALLDFDMLQTGHGLREVLGPTIATLRASLDANPPMPVVDGEVAYEALNSRIPADVPRLTCWACLLSGAAGHTYGANGIWQLNRRNAPYGNSPHGGNYGPIPWDEAMHLPGSTQVGLAKKLLESLHLEKFESHPEWARLSTPSTDKWLVPYAAGIPNRLRVIYVPTGDAITVRGLEPGVHYAITRFDPVTGKTEKLGIAQGDREGSWTATPPHGWDHDWAVVLEVK